MHEERDGSKVSETRFNLIHMFYSSGFDALVQAARDAT